MNPVQFFDAVIFGGGLFGSYAALYLKSRGRRVAIVEKEDRLFGKASIVNQARLHNGCHYPRSIATACQAYEHRSRFIAEHRAFVKFDFAKYYAIDRYNSLTDAAQFERFCSAVGIGLTEVSEIPGICFDRLERVYETVEQSFDPFLIAEYYKRRLKEANIPVYLDCDLQEAEESTSWSMRLHNRRDGETYLIKAPTVVNATYAGINGVNTAFGITPIDVQHEVAEIVLTDCPALAHIGFTVMDGPFCSIMPYGLSGLLSLSSVVYTHHAVLRDADPRAATYASNRDKMLAQLRQYICADIVLTPQLSLFTVKTKLKASHIDDSRPTLIRLLREKPAFFCLFGGKINSIYEIERELENV